MAEVQRRSGGHLDPTIAAAFAAGATDLLAPIAAGSMWDVVLDAEPGPPVALTEGGFDRAAGAFARYVDIKSVWTVGHSTGVAELAAAAGEAAGLDAAAQTRLRRAGWLHDLGRVAVPNRVWDKPGPLNRAERQQAEAHAYETDRILTSSPALGGVATVARAAHERVDGSGYHRSVPATLLDLEARLLAAADVHHALREDRPHRSAVDRDDAGRILAAEAQGGRLDLARCVPSSTPPARPPRATG